jgi:hypothetical protein
MKILVVNDEGTAGNPIAEILHRNRHHVLPLCDLLEAAEHAEHLTFDAAVITTGRVGASFVEIGTYFQTLMPRCKLIFVIRPDILWFAQGLVDRKMIGDFGFLPEGFKTEDLLRRHGEVEFQRSRDSVLQL